MSKPICVVSAAALLMAVWGSAQAQPRPRFPTRLPAPVIATAAAVQPAAPAPVAEPVAAPVQEAPRAAPLGAIEASPLPVLAAPPPEALAPAEPQTPPPAESPAPVSAATEPAPGPRLSHLVGPGDTFYAIGRRYGVGPQAVAEANGLTLESTLRLGQRIALPAGALDRGPEAAFPTVRRLSPPTSPVSAETPVVAAPPEPVAVARSEPPVVASPAQPVAAPQSQANVEAPPPAARRLNPPTRPPVVTPPVSSAASLPVAPAAVQAPRPWSPPTRPPMTAPPPAITPAPGAAAPVVLPAAPSASAAVTPSLAWPVRGDVLAAFGPTGVGQRNDGVRISAPEGAPVRASAGGRVVYAGDQVKGGYGKLVLVEHEGRWFTAYAHLSDIRVRMQDRVEQGQELGTVGRTGSVAAPQLYFEVRHAPTPADRARPVDPMPLLPQ